MFLVAEEEVKLCEGGEVEVKTVPDQAEQRSAIIIHAQSIPNQAKPDQSFLARYRYRWFWPDVVLAAVTEPPLAGPAQRGDRVHPGSEKAKSRLVFSPLKGQ